MTPRPSRLVLLGHPVAHSLSPTFQNAALRSAGLPLGYEALDVAPAALADALRALVNEGAAGNVTIPHKEAVAARSDRRTTLADRVGAVNTFWVEDGALVGDNTDVGGVDYLATHALGERPRDLRIAVLGAGGAAAAVLAAIERWPGCHVSLWNRTPERASRLAERFPVVEQVTTDAAAAARDATIVINATAVGLSGDDVPLPVEALPCGAAVLDLVYRDGGTAWVRAARERGHVASDGLPMLLEQGALAFERWFGIAAPREAMWGSVGLAP